MKIEINNIYFTGKPHNYAQVDEHLSRSAQPHKADFKWLKKQGVTDVFNFRTMHVSGINYDEKSVVESLGMKYHNIPSYTRCPKEENIKIFLNEMKGIIENNGKAHVHCKAGADRTGMYVFIYKMLNKIGTMEGNIVEWIKFGHNQRLYPDLINWTMNFIKNFK